MVQRFDEHRNRPARALQIWLILIGRAANRQTITYRMLSELLGFKGAGTLADVLGHIAFYCQQNNLPSLTVLVVNQDTGLPGEGLEKQVVDLNAERESVFRFNWFGIFPPTVEELSEAFKTGRTESSPD